MVFLCNLYFQNHLTEKSYFKVTHRTTSNKVTHQSMMKRLYSAVPCRSDWRLNQRVWQKTDGRTDTHDRSTLGNTQHQAIDDCSQNALDSYSRAWAVVTTVYGKAWHGNSIGLLSLVTEDGNNYIISPRRLITAPCFQLLLPAAGAVLLSFEFGTGHLP